VNHDQVQSATSLSGIRLRLAGNAGFSPDPTVPPASPFTLSADRVPVRRHSKLFAGGMIFIVRL